MEMHSFIEQQTLTDTARATSVDKVIGQSHTDKKTLETNLRWVIKGH